MTSVYLKSWVRPNFSHRQTSSLTGKLTINETNSKSPQTDNNKSNNKHSAVIGDRICYISVSGWNSSRWGGGLVT